MHRPMETGFAQTLLRRPSFEAAVVEAMGATAAFARHTHDEFVISANVGGAERIWLDGRSLEAGPGDITVYEPGAMQASQGASVAGSRWGFVSLYAEPGFVARTLGLPQPPPPGEPVLRDRGLFGQFMRLRRIIALRDGTDDGLAEETVVAILAATVGAGGCRRPVPRGDALVRRVATLLTDRLGDHPSLTQIAAEVGISREHLVRRFSAAYGMPPMRWALQRRVARARTLLRAGTPPADVAAALGFTDQAHLTRVFRDAMGTTPGRYRAGN
jgi:AraC family transcriptional regulator, chemosensory pili system protein ChpD